jgi:large subunit ribosomal protein L19
MNIASLVEIKKNPKIPDIAPGDTVRVSARIVEGGKERIQVFQGVILKIKKGGTGASFTVRHVAFGIGVERTFPLYSSLVEKVEIVRQGKVRRSRLYYLRGLSGKEARRKIKRVERKVREQVGEELLQSPPEEIEEPVAEAVAEEKPEAAVEEKLEAAAEEKTEAVVEEKPEAAAAAATPDTVAEAKAEEAPPAAENKETT